MENTDVPDYFSRPILVFGCGNDLLGDDGFGPAVMDYYHKKHEIPDFACVMNVGTSIRKILFDIVIGESKPDKIVVIDALDVGKKAGEVFELPLDDIPEIKIDDFSMHQVPTSNLLKELRDYCSVEIVILACQIENIPEMVQPGLSVSVSKAIPVMCEMIHKIIYAE